MNPAPHHLFPSSIHQSANFPPNLEIKRCRIEKESRTSGRNADTISSSGGNEESFLEDVRSFGIAAKTWDASFRLLDYLIGTPSKTSSDEEKFKIKQSDHHPYRYQPVSPLLINNPTSATLRKTIVLDLGSGACHLPIGLARVLSECKEYSNQHIDIMATDLKDVLPLLQRKTSREKLADNVRISARALTWGNVEELIQLIDSLALDTSHLENNVEEEAQFIITCSDLIFFRWLFGPLIRTLLFLTSPASFYPPTLHKLRPSHRSLPTATIYIGYKQRSEFLEFPFFLLLGRYFKLERITSLPKSTSEPKDLAADQNSLHDLRKEEEEEEEEDIIHLLKATRHPSTLDLDLSLIFNDVNDSSGSNTSSLSKYGLPEGADQWELMTLSNLCFRI